MIDEQIKKNIKDILTGFAQKNHLDYFKKWEIKKRRKEDCITEIINSIESDNEKYIEFKEWFAKFSIDGNNYYYIFDCESLKIEDIKKYIDTIELNDLVSITYDSIPHKKCIYKLFDEQNNRIILRYVTRAEIVYREDRDGAIYSLNDKTLFFYTILVDFNLNQVIVSISHTTGLASVENKKIIRGNFKEITKFIVSDLQNECNDIKLKSCEEWIYNGLDKFAEEGTAHNNPEITQVFEENVNKINKFAKDILMDSGILEDGIVNNFNEDIKILYETMLIEGLGIIEGSEAYQVFMINGDKVGSFFNVESRTQTLKEGREFAIAKTVRQISDIRILGIKKLFENEINKFLIEVDTFDNEVAFYMVKTDTSKFMKESVIANVIRKVGSYKEDS